MPQHLSHLLRETIDRELPELRNLSNQQTFIRPNHHGSWSPNEELGHLIDSVANNHIRFVLAALESGYHGPAYAQNDWVRLHGYQGMQWDTLVDFWYQYNALLTTLVMGIPADKLPSKCIVGAGEAVTLAFLIEDYVLHMQHHIDHILNRASITAYPSAAPLHDVSAV